MVENPTKAYKALIALSSLFTVAAILTLIPRAAASYPNLLGYRSICTFAPIATALCGLLAGITCVIRARLVAPRPRAGKSPAAIIVVFVILIGIAVAFVPSYAKWKTDAASGATEAVE